MLVFCCLSYDLSTSWWELAWQPDACTPGYWVLVHRVANAPPTKGYCEVKKWSEVTQSCPTLCDPMDCSPPGSSILGIFQARVLEWVAISYQCWSELSVLCNGCGLSIIYSMSTICLFVIFFFLPCSLWDISSPSRDWTWATAVKLLSPNCWNAREFLHLVYVYRATTLTHHNWENVCKW